MARLKSVLPALLLLSLPAAFGANKGRTISDAEVRRVHDSAILIDLHNDVTSRTVQGMNFHVRQRDSHTDTVRLKEGGVTAVFYAAYVSRRYVATSQAAHRLMAMIDTIRHDIAGANPDDYLLAYTADDIVRAKQEGKLAALIGIEGGHAIEDDLRILRAAYDLGARYMTLTHSNTNNWADSSGDIGKSGVKHHGGLTELGRNVVREMNRLGMMVDISHVSDQTFWDALETSSAPLVATHSNCRSISNIGRNMDDKMIRALAAKGGVVHINFGCEFLSQASADASPWLNPALRGKKGVKVPPASIADIVSHINYVVKLAGVGSVGIGSDFDGVDCVPTGLSDVSEFPNLTRALLEEGYSAAEIHQIYGGNTLRVMRAVEAAAASR